MNKKTVILKILGNLEKGYYITLEIWGKEPRPLINKPGKLPPSLKLKNQIDEHWEEKYRPLGAPFARIKPGNINYNGSVNQKQIDDCKKSAENLSKNFNNWLNNDGFREIERRFNLQFKPDDQIQLLIQGDDEYLTKMPWEESEFLQAYKKAQIAFIPSEYSQYNTNTKLLKFEFKVRILAILGHEEGIDINKDRKILEKLPNAEVVFLVEPDKSEINDKLWEQNWHIIFFAGHSETEGDTGRIYINSQLDINENSLTIEELWYGLRKAVENGLQIAIFNSCDGIGLTKQINDFLIPQMIIMRELVPDEVAQEFLKYFLQNFAEGQSLYLAVRNAKDRLKHLESKFPCASWLPLIYQHPSFSPPKWQSFLTSKFISTGLISLLGVGLLGISGFFVRNYVSEKSSYEGRLAQIKQNGEHLKLSSDYASKGLKKLNQKNFEFAYNDFELALKLNPRNSNALYGMATYYESQSKPDKALWYAEKLRKIDNIKGCNIEAVIYNKQEKYSLARDILIPCYAQIQPSDKYYISNKHSILKNLGWALFGNKQYEDAENRLTEALKLGVENENNGAIYCLLAKIGKYTHKDKQYKIEKKQNCRSYAIVARAEERLLYDEIGRELE